MLDISLEFINSESPNTSKDVIINHIASKGIHVVKCEKIVGKADWYVPFKVTVKASDRDKLLNPDIDRVIFLLGNSVSPECAVTC